MEKCHENDFLKIAMPKKGNGFHFKPQQQQQQQKKLNLAMLRFAFVHFLPCSSEVGF